MHYLIEPIGAEFSTRAVAALAGRFNHRLAEGYRLHSVFQISQPGCLGIGQSVTNNLAVYERIAPPPATPRVPPPIPLT